MARGGRAARTATAAAAPGAVAPVKSIEEPMPQQTENIQGSPLTKAALMSLPTPNRRKASKAKVETQREEWQEPDEDELNLSCATSLPTPLSTAMTESEATGSTSASTLVTPTSVTSASIGMRAVAEEAEELEVRSQEGLVAPPIAPAPTQAAPAPEKPTTPTAAPSVPPTAPPSLPPTVAAALASCPSVPAPTMEAGSGPVKLSLGPLTLGGNPLPPPPAGPPVLPLELQSALPQPQQPSGAAPAGMTSMAPMPMGPPCKPAMSMQHMQVGPAPWNPEGQQHGSMYTPGLYREMLRTKGRDLMRRSPLWSKSIAATMGQSQDPSLSSLPAAQALGLVSGPASASPMQQPQHGQPQMMQQHQQQQLAMQQQHMAMNGMNNMHMAQGMHMQMAPQQHMQQLPAQQQQPHMLHEQTVSLSPAVMAAPQQQYDGGACMQQAYFTMSPDAAMCQPQQAACPVSSFITGATAGLTNQEIAAQLKAAAEVEYED